MSDTPRLLYCHCSFAKVVPPEVKQEVLAGLSASGKAFDAVADLCEMSARKDPALARLAEGGSRIAACYPRAVKWLFHAAGHTISEDRVEVLNMREASAAEVLDGLFAENSAAEESQS